MSIQEIHQDKPASKILTRLLNTKFLPILQKPREFPLPWKGEELVENSQVLLAPNEAFLEEKKYLVCCTVPLIGVSIPKERKFSWFLENGKKFSI